MNVTYRTEFQCSKRCLWWLGTSFVSLMRTNHRAVKHFYKTQTKSFITVQTKKIICILLCQKNEIKSASSNKWKVTRTFTAGMLKGQFSTFPSVRAPQISYIAQYPADFFASTPHRILYRICIGKFKPNKKAIQKFSKYIKHFVYFENWKKQFREISENMNKIRIFRCS